MQDQLTSDKTVFLTSANACLKKAHKEYDKTLLNMKQEFITQRVEEIKGSRNSATPSAFFKKCDPNSIYANQQLYTVEIQSTQTPTISNNPDMVKKIASAKWEHVMSSKTPPSSLHPAFLKHNKLLQAYKNIHSKNTHLIAPVTTNEISAAVRATANRKQPGPDRIPNEIFKALESHDQFCLVLAKLFSTCMQTGCLPNAWKTSSIFLIHKSGSTADPLNYRPIALLNTSNKIFTVIVNKRMSTFLEKQQIFSNMQGGFRVGKTTFTKIWSLVQTIEDSKINKKPLHTCYIDLKKAYDSVEHWGLCRVMQAYGFDPDVIRLIKNLCINNHSSIITPHGLSNAFNITRGVRQGCPLSPTLFILFLNPLLTWLEDSNLGYPVHKTNIPGGAFADDIVLTAPTNARLQQMFNMCVTYFDFFGLEMAIDGRDKTVYTSNRGHCESKSLLYKNKPIVWLPPEDSYKYLGVYINLNLDWTKQHQVSNLTFIKHLAYLRRRCFTASQTVEILNLVVFPAITYRMCVVQFPKELLDKWDLMARCLISAKLHTGLHLGYKFWSLPLYYGGYNLFLLKDLQLINTIAIFLNFSANSSNIYTNVLSLANFGQSDIIKHINQLLTPLRLSISVNPCIYDVDYECKPSHYITSASILQHLANKNLDDIRDFITADGKLLNLACIKDVLHLQTWKAKQHKMLQSHLCSPNSDTQIAPHAVFHTSLMETGSTTLNSTQNTYFDIEYQAFEVFVDESLKDNKAAFGVFYGNNCNLNCSTRVYGPQTLQNATFQGVEHVLELFPKNENVSIYIDRESALQLLWKLPLPPSKNNHVHELNMLNKISYLIAQRSGTTSFKQVFSHLQANCHTTAERKEVIANHIDKLHQKYGTARTQRLIEGNEVVDVLADKGLNKPDLNCPPLTNFHNNFILESTRTKQSAANPYSKYIYEHYRHELFIIKKKKKKKKKKRSDQCKQRANHTKYTRAVLKSK